jgi:hypothetical protein
MVKKLATLPTRDEALSIFVGIVQQRPDDVRPRPRSPERRSSKAQN